MAHEVRPRFMRRAGAGGEATGRRRDWEQAEMMAPNKGEGRGHGARHIGRLDGGIRERALGQALGAAARGRGRLFMVGRGVRDTAAALVLGSRHGSLTGSEAQAGRPANESGEQECQKARHTEGKLLRDRIGSIKIMGGAKSHHGRQKQRKIAEHGAAVLSLRKMAMITE